MPSSPSQGLKITRWMRRCRSGAGADRPNRQLLPRDQDHRTADDNFNFTLTQPRSTSVNANRILGDDQPRLTKMAERRAPAPDLTPSRPRRARTSATKPIRRPWPSWSTTSIATPLPPTQRRHDLHPSADGQRFRARVRPGREHRARQPEVRR